MSKVWFVTGASSGIGTGVVKSALQAGHRVVATARNLEKLRAALGEGDGERLALMKLDVTQEAQAAAVVEAAVARFGAVDVLVNNAGYFLLGSFESFTNAQLERQFATNFYGVAHLMRAVLPVMRRQRSGYIFNISSMAGLLGFKEAGAYAATKFAVEGLSQSVAQEVEPFGIKVIAVEPGFFRTELVAPQSMDYGERAVEGYAPLETLKAAWATLRSSARRSSSWPRWRSRLGSSSQAAMPWLGWSRPSRRASKKSAPRCAVEVDGRHLLKANAANQPVEEEP
jgi:NAD(P)-dependent dehydrogenase (short-subunit alcohol dehydrogenase family)